MIIVIIVGLYLATALNLIGICYPELLKRPFQPLIDRMISSKSTSDNKSHKLSRNQTSINKLIHGQTIRHTISEKWGARFLISGKFEHQRYLISI